MINAYRALTELPQPGVYLLENWLFDDKSIDSKNDADGRVDSGETIHLAIEAINRSGQANNVMGSLRAHANGAVFDDPYVTVLVSNVNFGDIGPFNIADNGFVYDTNGVIKQVEHPFVFTVSSNCPNDHVIVFELTFTFEDGWNPEVPGPYERISYFHYGVQRGKNVPRVISTNTTLSANEFWMVASPVLIEPGATLTIGPGTQMQWGGISDDPYNPGPQNGNLIVRGSLQIQGTSNAPVNFFPSYLVAGQVVSITVEDGGIGDMSYTKVMNPRLSGFHSIDHGSFYWDYDTSVINSAAISNSVFHRLRGGGSISAQLFECCLFDANWMPPSFSVLRNCALLQDNEHNHPLTIPAPATIDTRYFGGVYLYLAQISDANWRGVYHAINTNGLTYVSLPAENSAMLQEAELIANYFGGHVTSITNQDEQAFLEHYVTQPTEVSWVQPPNAYLIGLTDEGSPGQYYWLDGTPMSYSNWAPGYPVILPPLSKHTVVMQNTVPSFNPNAERSIPWTGPWHNMAPFGPYRENTLYWDGLAFILKIPGTWTAEQINAQIANKNVLNYARSQFKGNIVYNAFLSPFWNPNVNTWMHIQSGGGQYSSMNFNYWGTTSTELIDHMIYDYYDNFSSARVDYSPPAEHGYSTTYPFVEKVSINGISAENVPEMGSGRTDFTILFSRDMNTNIEPFVSFGPSSPFTDFSILPRNEKFHTLSNGWLNSRTWQGSAWLTPVTGDGYHMLRISDAAAADDPWLVTGYDTARFRFEVRTMKLESMDIQAIGKEGSIELTWRQNDYALLAGYNLYRSEAANGTFTRINNTIIPPGSEIWRDTNVPPAQKRYYKFTTVMTDMTESDYSNVAAAAAVDTIPPVITHVPVTLSGPSAGLRLTATVTDNMQVISVTVFYRTQINASNYTAFSMINISNTTWSATIPGSAIQPPAIEYYIVASDGISQVYSGSAVTPHSVVISDQPALTSVTPNHGPATGGTTVTLAGLQFQNGATVLFGGAFASNVVLLNANQLTCVTPPHFPSTVEVKIINTNGSQATLLNGFIFDSTGTVISLPSATGDYGAIVEVALSAANLNGLRAADLLILYDPTVIASPCVNPGTLTAGWALTANTSLTGRIVLSMASATAVSGSGSLARITFNVVGRPPVSCPLVISNANLNDGSITTSLSQGSFTVNGFWNAAGLVTYFQGADPVRDAHMSMTGTGTYSSTTAINGQFLITNLPTGSYTLTPNKANDVAGITSYDASMVLQAAAGLITLNTFQRMAADVNRNNVISSMDAAYILEKSVGLMDGPFPNAGRIWDFSPASRTYANLNSDQAGQDFIAVLIGDVSGNWPQASGVVSPAKSSRTSSAASASAALALDKNTIHSNLNQTRVLFDAGSPGIFSVDLVLSYRSASASVVKVSKGTGVPSILMVCNTNVPGTIRVGLASATPIIGSGDMIVLELSNNVFSGLEITSASINENTMAANLAPDASAFDSDSDGLLDMDETNIYHTNPYLTDTDGDFMNDGSEILAGTNPNDRQSNLRIEIPEWQPEGIVTLKWNTVPGKRYKMEYQDEIGSSEWIQLGAIMPATNSTISVTDPSVGRANSRIYRIKIATE